MDSLRELLLSHEDWLIYRVIDYARVNDYSQYTPTLVSAWRESVVGLRDDLIRALDAHPGPLPMPADHDYCDDPHTAFAIGSARRHRARGVTLALFLGLTKYFRLTFLDLVDKADWPEPDARRARERIARYFDRIELAIGIDWASLGESEKIAEVQDKSRALANEKDKYLTIFESLEDPVFVLDERDGIENMNGAAWRLFGVENDPGALYYRPEGASAALRAVAERLAPSSLVDGASLALQTSAGESFFDVRRRDILDICDKYAGSVVILNDVTTHKRALRAAEEANRAKSAFLATMTHELRTPLNGVLGAMRLIRDEGLTDAQHEFADTIERSGERLLGVINNVLDYSRIEAGRIEIERAPFALSEMLDGVLAIIRPRAIESGVRLTLDCMTPGGTHRLGDAGKIQQVLLNLVGNAMKFATRGKVSVSVRPVDEREGRLRFEVVDDGIGVGGAALGQLFEPFTQIHPHTTDRGQGAGLGLAISRALVTGMGGEIGAERREEVGSRFWFELDLPPVEAVARSAPAAASADIRGQPARTILLVEDDEVNRVVGKALLERRGHRVLVAATGTAAVQVICDRRVDVVLMDIRLPDIDGFEAAKRIRALHGLSLNGRAADGRTARGSAPGGSARRNGPTSDGPASDSGLSPPRAWPDHPAAGPGPPIIALTAQIEPSDAMACKAAGVDDLVVKPFSPDDLCRRIETLIEDRRRRPANGAANGEGAADWLDQRVFAEHFVALGPARAARILDAFAATAEHMLETLAEPGAGGDALADPAHRLAGSAAALGLPRLHALARGLERAARLRTRELTTLAALMPAAIDASRRRLDAYWSSLRDETSGPETFGSGPGSISGSSPESGAESNPGSSM